VVHLSGADGVALGESFAYTWRGPSSGGGAPISPIRGSGGAQVVLTRTPPRLEVDSTQTRREVGYVGMVELALDGRAHALTQAGRGIADIVAAGDRLARVHTGENAVAALAFERMLIDMRDHEYRLAFVPRTPPEVTITPGTLTIDVVY
jgi:hypothetical protein